MRIPGVAVLIALVVVVKAAHGDERLGQKGARHLQLSSRRKESEAIRMPQPAIPQSPGRLFFLEAIHGNVKSCRTDGSDMRTLASGYMGRTPDGIQIDRKNKHIYWTCMGLIWTVSNLMPRAR